MAKALVTYAAQALTTGGRVEELQRKHRALKQENQDLRRAMGERSTIQTIIGMSPGIQQIVRTIDQICDYPFDVLITGVRVGPARNSSPKPFMRIVLAPRTRLSS